MEVKYKDMKKPQIGRSLRSFIGKYRPDVAWVVNLGLRDEVKVDSTEVRFLTFWEVGIER